MTLGEKIVGLRKERGLSQEKLAEILNVSRQTISKWESDQVLPDLNNIVALSKTFQVTTDELIMGNEIPNSKTTPQSELDKLMALVKRHWCKIGYVMVAWGSYRFVMLLLVFGLGYYTSNKMEESMYGMSTVFEIQGELIPKSIQMIQFVNAFLPMLFYIGVIGLGFFLIWKDRHQLHN